MIAPVTRLEPLWSITDLAREVDRPRRTLFRQLVALHDVDVLRGEEPWLFRVTRRKWNVNKSVLRAVHPELFQRRYVTRAEWEDHEGRISALEQTGRESVRRIGAIGARLRPLEEKRAG